jgi:hypothetical protein
MFSFGAALPSRRPPRSRQSPPNCDVSVEERSASMPGGSCRMDRVPAVQAHRPEAASMLVDGRRCGSLKVKSLTPKLRALMHNRRCAEERDHATVVLCYPAHPSVAVQQPQPHGGLLPSHAGERGQDLHAAPGESLSSVNGRSGQPTYATNARRTSVSHSR